MKGNHQPVRGARGARVTLSSPHAGILDYAVGFEAVRCVGSAPS